MNKQTAIGLVVGSFLGLATAFITGETKYYRSGLGEVSKEKYDGESEYNSELYYSNFQFNNTFILLALIGGTGLGYLFSGQIENKVVGVYRGKIKR